MNTWNINSCCSNATILKGGFQSVHGTEPLWLTWVFFLCLWRYPEFQDYHLLIVSWMEFIPSDFLHKLETLKVWTCDSCSRSCCLSNVSCAACIFGVEVTQKNEFLFKVSSTSHFQSSWHHVSASVFPCSSVNSVTLPLSAGCRGRQDYRGNRMCMAELLGRAAKMLMALSLRKSAQVTGLLNTQTQIAQKSLWLYW